MTQRHFFNRRLKGFFNLTAIGAMSACMRDAMPGAGPDTQVSPRRRPVGDLKKMALSKNHHGQGRFLNPFNDAPRGRLNRILKWKLLTRNRFRPIYREEIIHPVSIEWPTIIADRGFSVTYLKHATVLIKDVDAYILMDPLFGDISCFIEDFSPLAFNRSIMPTADYVLVTHGHYDHLDETSLTSGLNGGLQFAPTEIRVPLYSYSEWMKAAYAYQPIPESTLAGRPFRLGRSIRRLSLPFCSCAHQ